MKKRFATLLIISISVLLFSCHSKQGLTEKQIDSIVESILDSNQVYDIAQSLRFSNETDHYNVVEYSQNDSSKLFVESYYDNESEYTRQIYLQNGKVVFVKEFGFNVVDNLAQDYEIKAYVFNETEQLVYKKTLDENEEGNFVKQDENIKIDIKKPKNAVLQKGDFEMKFGEFLVVPPQSYLILENKESKYNVALFIQEGDFLLDELFTNPEEYKGKTIFANHEFLTMNGVERMVYRGGILIEN